MTKKIKIAAQIFFLIPLLCNCGGGAKTDPKAATSAPQSYRLKQTQIEILSQELGVENRRETVDYSYNAKSHLISSGSPTLPLFKDFKGTPLSGYAQNYSEPQNGSWWTTTIYTHINPTYKLDPEQVRSEIPASLDVLTIEIKSYFTNWNFSYSETNTSNCSYSAKDEFRATEGCWITQNIHNVPIHDANNKLINRNSLGYITGIDFTENRKGWGMIDQNTFLNADTETRYQQAYTYSPSGVPETAIFTTLLNYVETHTSEELEILNHLYPVEGGSIPQIQELKRTYSPITEGTLDVTETKSLNGSIVYSLKHKAIYEHGQCDNWMVNLPLMSSDDSPLFPLCIN